jgi:hypothetical protein
VKYKCRCNKRSCQARVTRAKHPDEYKVKKYSMCPRYPACDGKLYVDWFRMDRKNSEKDSGELCYEDCLPHVHRKNNSNCKHNPEFKIESTMNPKKHNPFQNDFEENAERGYSA